MTAHKPYGIRLINSDIYPISDMVGIKKMEISLDSLRAVVRELHNKGYCDFKLHIRGDPPYIEIRAWRISEADTTRTPQSRKTERQSVRG